MVVCDTVESVTEENPIILRNTLLRERTFMKFCLFCKQAQVQTPSSHCIVLKTSHLLCSLQLFLKVYSLCSSCLFVFIDEHLFAEARRANTIIYYLQRKNNVRKSCFFRVHRGRLNGAASEDAFGSKSPPHTQREEIVITTERLPGDVMVR